MFFNDFDRTEEVIICGAEDATLLQAFLAGSCQAHGLETTLSTFVSMRNEFAEAMRENHYSK